MKINSETMVSIIIPTYNEEKDIKQTLDKLILLTYKHKEIIVVDDSTDTTPNIVLGFKDENVKLIHRKKNVGGRCGARNVGIKEAKGEILIILNADVLLPVNFIERILPHYENGADYVLVESIVANLDKLFGRYVEAQYHSIYDNQNWIEWTEGFSCTKKAAIEVGMFPESPIPLVAGEDGFFGEQLHNIGFKKIIDRNINVFPIVPDDLKGFWKCRQEKRSALPLYFLYNRSLNYLIFREIRHTAYTLFYIISILPLLANAFKLTAFSNKGLNDLFPFTYCIVIEKLATISGGWGSLVKVVKYKNKSSSK